VTWKLCVTFLAWLGADLELQAVERLPLLGPTPSDEHDSDPAGAYRGDQALQHENVMMNNQNLP